MKNLINSVLIVVVLSGCSAITTVKKYWPRDHDPALASAYVTTKLSSDKLGCGDKKNFETWDAVIFKAEWLDEYAKFRDDPQQESTASIVENLNKAKSTSSERACEIWLNLVKQRFVVLNKAWSGR
jgi:uncharacterized protein YceK